MNALKMVGEFYFSQLIGQSIYDKAGNRFGRVKDIAVRWEGVYPRVIGVKYANKIHNLIPIEWIVLRDNDRVELVENFTVDQTVPLHENDIYASKWLLDKQIIDIKGSKMVRVNDIILSWVVQDGKQHMVLVAVDIGVRGLFRRLGLEFLFTKFKQNWLILEFIKPLESWNSHLQLNRLKQQLTELHPADIAELIEEMDYKRRANFIENLDDQQAIDTLAELNLDTQVEIIEQMDAQRASDILEEMAPDEAADILGELPVEKSEGLLQLMESDDAEEVRELMQYEQGTAGALMTNEFIAFSSHITTEEAINQLRELSPTAETIYYLYVMDDEEHLQGVLSLRELIVAAPQTTLKELMHTKVAVVQDEDNYQKVAEVINKYSLLAVPVVDEQNVMVGIVTVDDILDILMPERGKLDTYSWFALTKTAGRGR
ncbi:MULTISPECIES: magnesium transporter [Pelosinus]|uniref:MgtE intracellular region n=1 Tax=Pelosinus fermentans B4 TaxID=1149862 RepID=I9LFD5_9FIRM|nr:MULTISPECIES: CBS domain-containing protein [Pelosinus]EIW19199.1 MgtE intracellular region [Pelosinus fermentans B4]EIW25069.1 MgtE intracellular region [Pelosinus fermentans A11]OAM96180.1 MgtE intracellular region [Pelosinus fermentans DSM 17108]SDR37228.1 Mg2+ transporter (mgtE) [Pelosinus fermentans]